MGDPSKIRNLLQLYDQTGIAPTRQAVALLDKITEEIVSHPQTYLDEQAWEEAGGLSYAEKDDFPQVLGKRWLEVLTRTDLPTYDKNELKELKDSFEDWGEEFEKMGLALGSKEELMQLSDQLIAAAPEPIDEDEDD